MDTLTIFGSVTTSDLLGLELWLRFFELIRLALPLGHLPSIAADGSLVQCPDQLSLPQDMEQAESSGIQCGIPPQAVPLHKKISTTWFPALGISSGMVTIADLVEFGCLRRTQKTICQYDRSEHFGVSLGAAWYNWRLRSQVLTNINYLRGKETKNY